MRVLVTRPLEDAEDTAARLRALGHEPLVVPLLSIRYREGAEISLDDVQAILVTSANGIRALALRTTCRDMPVLAVGAQSAQAASEAGFRNVAHANGDAAALAVLARGRLSPDAGPLLHVAGAETRGRLAENLTSHGFTVRTETLYDAVAETNLPAAIKYALSGNTLDAVLFFSPRTAQIFATLVRSAALTEACRHVLALCISRAAADALSPLAFRAIRIASHPNHDALLALLDNGDI